MPNHSSKYNKEKTQGGNTVIINDRRQHALGGQRVTGRDAGGYAHGRNYDNIDMIVWHYTAVKRSLRRFITDHERYWASMNWSRGGYHFYIDADGKIWWNYDLRRVTFGAGNVNNRAIHISVEANHKNDYSKAQIDARDWLTRKLMNDHKITAKNVIGHKEAPGQSTSCPGYSVAELNAFRRDLEKRPEPKTETVKVDKTVPLQVSLNDLKFDTNQWGTKIVEASGKITVLGTRIMSRFGSPNIKSDRGGWANPDWSTEFDQIAIAGGFAWVRYKHNDRIKYLPIAEVLNGKIGDLWVKFE